LFYSPHGFSFLKQDVSRLKRAIFFSIEVIAGLFGGKIIASCVTEGDLAHKVVGRRRVIVVENCTDIPDFIWPKSNQNSSVQVMSAGRLCYQKAPWRFWKLSSTLIDENAQFYWVGDGELRKQLENDTTYKKIHVSGWVDRDQLWREMYAADILVMTSLWEGMPLVLLDAQALGLPAVVTDVVGCRDVVQNGVTGFICQTDEELIEKTQLLIRDSSLRKKMSEAARTMAAERFSIQRMHSEILEAYGLAPNL
jgi:glycosyltransferase involved in cell wall biosynthesis